MWAIRQWKHYFQGSHPIIIQTDHAPLRQLINQTSVNSRLWRWLAIFQGYDLAIRHIPGKKIPADSLNRQLVADALVRKGSVKDANAEYIQTLRVKESVTDQEIQEALHQLFKSRPQGIQSSQGQSVLTAINPQGTISSTNDQTSPQGNSESEEKPSLIAATAISKIQLDNVFKNSLYSSLQNESPYSEILLELSGGQRQKSMNDLIFKK